MVIMVVDDVPIMRKILVDILVKYCGMEHRNIYEAVDGETAVSEYERLRPNMVFLDFLMPNWDGKKTVEAIKKIDPDAYIVMYSAATEERIVDDCVEAGASDYILKPPDPVRVLVALDRYKEGKE
ncbi:MAG: response regulator [Defluviitaleaceae bacterium]|nr:response regulator [Defluviitaleaceae bacterium]